MEHVLSKRITASAPGSLMLLGEHAVLHNRMALVCAIDHRVTITCIPRNDSTIHIDSALGQYTTDVQHLSVETPFTFILASLLEQQSRLHSGLDIHIDSTIPHTFGLGSSAAVTVAFNGALAKLLDMPMATNPHQLHRHCLDIVHKVQGRGSGADLAAAVFGGVVAYQLDPEIIEPIKVDHPITVVYSGYKTPTSEVINIVETQRKQHPDLYEHIYNAIDTCSHVAFNLLKQKNWEAFGQILNLNQHLMEAIGVNTPELAEIIHILQKEETISGAKISGSGLGDCAIGWGTAAMKDSTFEAVPASITSQGLTMETDK